ncbi:hypothetical protein [uncultured Methylobacterium sp.]|uniref:hypothetical protein n=1 Tax=uncultured Methylobacterium sp. TaxID=157278 RepID=UPI0035CA6CD7
MFHDASVSRFLVRETDLVIEVEAFSFSWTETMPPARIVIVGAQCTVRNGEKIRTFVIETGDAEIHGLDAYPNGVRLVLFWHHRNPKVQAVCCNYWFPGATLRVEALSGGPFTPVRTSEPGDNGGM